ncbi:MAG TPA: hypothetical protein VMN56_02495 [Casimicrobiaceae bacterium]|nr:hypothetical protein [Casimicrobiaceae bacterium]
MPPVRFGEPPTKPARRSPLANGTAPPLVYRFDCTSGCLPLPPFLCAALLRDAIVSACGMVLAAAKRLEALPMSATTAQLFRSIFGHEPADPFPGTWNFASGDLVSCALRRVARTLRAGNVLYRCDPCLGAREDPAESSILDTHAIAIPARNVVLLCPSFWRLAAPLRAGVLVHEAFHLRFVPFFKHDAKERRQNSAYCYEVFTLTVTGVAPEPLAVTKCRNTP